MKILLDMECLQTASAFRGIGRYSLNLLKSLKVENRKKHDIHVLLNGKNSESEINLRESLDSTICQSKIHFWPNPYRSGCPDMNLPMPPTMPWQYDSFLLKEYILIISMFLAISKALRIASTRQSWRAFATKSRPLFQFMTLFPLK